MGRPPELVHVPGVDVPVWWHRGEERTAVLVLPGLGEPRAGVNYLWSELAAAVAGSGRSCVRPALAGCGNDERPASPRVWREDVDALMAFMRQHGMRPLVVARGAGAVALRRDAEQVRFIAVRPATGRAIDVVRRVVVENAEFDVGALAASGYRDELEDLGVESRCAEGLRFPRALPADLSECAREAARPDEIWYGDEPTHLTRAQRAAFVRRVVDQCS
jgi:hypothetical protein